MPLGPAEFRQDVPCAKKGPLPTECPSLPGKGKHKHLVLKWPLFFHSSRKKRVEAQVPVTQKEKGGSPGSCNPVAFSVFSQEDSWL